MSEAKMARASLKKTIAYATELLMLIGKEDDLEGWIQAKITEMDHNIDAVYSYYKFCEHDEEESEEEETESEDESEELVFSMDAALPRP